MGVIMVMTVFVPRPEEQEARIQPPVGPPNKCGMPRARPALQVRLFHFVCLIALCGGHHGA